jgi:putative membrane protein
MPKGDKIMSIFAKVTFTCGAGLLAGGLLVAASAVTGADSDFMKSAAKGGLAEVELGQMAVQKASDPSVKEFANRMIRDHSKANAALSELASSKGVTLPTGKGLSNDTSALHLKMLSGKQFDSAYVKMMVDDHKEDVAEFEKAAGQAADPDVRHFASKTLPTLKSHLSMIEKIQATLDAK